jgi:peptidoglycan/LPS O-acetylase OafA/YrhL
MNNISYFNGLNALRFFAAYGVVLHHAEQIRMKYGMFHLKPYILFNNGSIAVDFFFVLSGFLITYLLLKEQYKSGKVSVKKFYMRRILRIWPLYFLLVFTGTLLVPRLIAVAGYDYDMPYRFSDTFGYFLFFMPFMVNLKYGHHLLEPLWSIGVEEIFYLLWAPLFKFFKNHILKIILTVIFVKLLLSLIVYRIEIQNIFIQILLTLKFEAMAIGGLGAYYIFNRTKAISQSALFSRPIQFILFLFIIARLFFCNYLTSRFRFFDLLISTPVFSDYLLMFIFIWLIINIALNTQSIIKLNNKQLNFLGEISYGIYMYHMLVIFGITWICKDYLNRMPGILSTLVFYFILTIGVILIAYGSKRFFENYFMRLKAKFI